MNRIDHGKMTLQKKNRKGGLAMKRKPTLLIILCILILLSGIIIGARDKPIYLLWDMPFGLKIENCLALLQQNGYAFAETRNKKDENVLMLLSAKDADISYLSHPVDVTLLFSAGRYCKADILFRQSEAYSDAVIYPGGAPLEDAPAQLTNALFLYVDLLEQMEAQHPKRGGQLLLFERGKEVQVLPMRSDSINGNQVAALMQSTMDAQLTVQYDNISVVLEKNAGVPGETCRPMYTVLIRYEGDA